MNNESLDKIKADERKALDEQIKHYLKRGGRITKIKPRKIKSDIGVKVKSGKGLNPTVNDAGESRYTTEAPNPTEWTTD